MGNFKKTNSVFFILIKFIYEHGLKYPKWKKMRSRVSLLCLPLVSTKGTINRGFWSLSRDRQCVISTHTEICAPHPAGALIQPCLAPPPTSYRRTCLTGRGCGSLWRILSWCSVISQSLSTRGLQGSELCPFSTVLGPKQPVSSQGFAITFTLPRARPLLLFHSSTPAL